MATFPIGNSKYELEIVAEGFQRAASPLLKADSERLVEPENVRMTPLERNDFAAFQRVGWRFRLPERKSSEGAEVESIDEQGRVRRGLLAQHRAGLVVLQDRLVVQFKPWVTPQKVKKRLAKYSAFWPVERDEKIFEVEIRSPGAGLESALFSHLKELLAEVESPSGEVVFAEPSILYHLERPGDAKPIDPAPQWQWDTIALRNAWKIVGRGARVRVALIDYGFHESEDIPAKPAIVLDDQGMVVPGAAMPPDLHGTLCAGLVGARLGGLSVNGVAPECDLILVSVPEPGILSQVALSRAIRLCAAPSKYFPGLSKGADVISCSLGLPRRNWELGGALRRAIDFALEKGRPHRGRRLGCPVVWSVYNANEEIEPNSINGYRRLFSVSQSNDRDERIDSGFGEGLDCIAPGVGVVGIVCDPACRVFTGIGSSFAAPSVAGVAALVIAENRNLTWEQVAAVITDNCDRVGQVPKFPNPEVGWGRLNAEKAVAAAMTMRKESESMKSSSVAPAQPCPDAPPSVPPG